MIPLTTTFKQISTPDKWGGVWHGIKADSFGWNKDTDVGAFIYERSFSKSYITLQRLYVGKSFRGKGFARALMQYVVSAFGMHEIRTHISPDYEGSRFQWLTNRDRLIKLCAQFGFEKDMKEQHIHWITMTRTANEVR